MNTCTKNIFLHMIKSTLIFVSSCVMFQDEQGVIVSVSCGI